MEEKDFSSDTSDEDYMPDGGEQVSEEEESGVDEDIDQIASAPEDGKLNRRKSDTKNKKTKQTKTLLPRKRRGGIKLADEKIEATVQEELNSSTVSDDLTTESSKELESDKGQKQKADALWADFLKDVGSVPKKSQSDNVSAYSTTACNSRSTGVAKFPQPTPSTVKVTKEYDFAGETVSIVKDVRTDSKEGREALQLSVASDSSDQKTASTASVLKRPASSAAAGLGSVLGKIGKKPKINVLEKSKLDWDGFKHEEGISEELTTHNRGKDGYLERQAFLQRTDFRQFEIERNLRLGSSSTSKR